MDCILTTYGAWHVVRTSVQAKNVVVTECGCGISLINVRERRDIDVDKHDMCRMCLETRVMKERRSKLSVA